MECSVRNIEVGDNLSIIERSMRNIEVEGSIGILSEHIIIKAFIRKY